MLSGIAQRFSTPANGRGMHILGWVVTAAIFAATVGLVATWVMG